MSLLLEQSFISQKGKKIMESTQTLAVAVLVTVILLSLATAPCCGTEGKSGTSALAVHQSSPYYFQDAEGNPVWIAGDSDGVFSDYKYDYIRSFDTLKANGLNFMRVWVCKGRECGPDGDTVFHVAYQRTGPGKALDGRPKFDLNKFDPAFFERLKDVCQAAKDRGIYLQLILLDAWNIKRADRFNLNVCNVENNINGVDADVNKDGDAIDEGEYCSLTNKPVFEVQKALIRKVIDEVSHFDNIIFEIANENYYSAEWELALCSYVKECEKNKPFKHLVMPMDLPNHDYQGIKTWDLPKLHSELMKARNLKQPLIWCTDGIGVPEDDKVRKAIWTVFTSGGHTDILDGSLGRGANPTGRREIRTQYAHLVKFVKGVRFWEMTPDDAFIKAGIAYAMASDEELVGFIPSGGKVTFDLSKMSGNLKARWYNTRDGKFESEFSVDASPGVEVTAPNDSDWAIYISK